ncbi:MAG: hypothetical protein KDD44_12175, partial [Bdellovibrionales bacterium]|nr:hypothetical protein [Bdellovibrionales bacterium]
VINDFLSSLTASNYGFELYWMPASVQGPSAEDELIAALDYLQSRGDLDAILLFRGGGSRTELSIFNSYRLARAICLCSLPVVAAIGHQEDQSSVQDVSAVALGVPKDVGRYFSDLVDDRRRRFREAVGQTQTCASRVVERSHERVSLQASRLVAHFQRFVVRQAERLENFRSGLPRLAQTVLQRRHQQFAALAKPLPSFCRGLCREAQSRLRWSATRLTERARWRLAAHRQQLDRFPQLLARSREQINQLRRTVEHREQLVRAVSPSETLKLGYTLIRRKDTGAVVVRAKPLERGAEIEIEFHDATRQATITDSGTKT